MLYIWLVVCIADVGGTSYTALYNLLNFPAGVIPITKVTAEDEDQLRRYKGTFGSYADKLFIKVNVASKLSLLSLALCPGCPMWPWINEFIKKELVKFHPVHGVCWMSEDINEWKCMHGALHWTCVPSKVYFQSFAPCFQDTLQVNHNPNKDKVLIERKWLRILLTNIFRNYCRNYSEIFGKS